MSRSIGILVIKAYLLVFLILPLLSHSKNLVLAADDWPPYVDRNAEHYGFVCQLISRAFDKVGIKVHYHFTAWARALETSKKGDVDGTFLWYKTPKRTPFFYFSKEPLLHISAVFFSSKRL